LQRRTVAASAEAHKMKVIVRPRPKQIASQLWRVGMAGLNVTAEI